VSEPLDLDELERLLAAATVDEHTTVVFRHGELLFENPDGGRWSVQAYAKVPEPDMVATFRNPADGLLLVAAVNALPDLIAQVRAAEARLAALEAERDAWKLLAEGRADLLVCYRVGGRSPEKALRKIEQARAVLGEDA